MEIDIVDLTSEKYSDLSAVQLAMVRAAQTKKNEILENAAEAKKRLFYMMVANNAVRSTALRDEIDYVAQKANAEVETVKNDLDYQLAYEAHGSEGNDKGPYRYPENPNYNLSYSQRFLVVRNYYMEATSDPNARLNAYAMDSLAREYLGEFYVTLYDLLASYC